MKEISLTRGKVCRVSDCDYDWLSQHRWSAWWSGWKWYAVANFRGRVLTMHRIILGIQDSGFRVKCDHIDNDGLNNQRENLRIATNQQNGFNQKKNSANKSGYKGVHKPLGRKKWVAKIKFCQKNIDLGTFDDPKDAARAYDKKAIELFGEFALTNERMGYL